MKSIELVNEIAEVAGSMITNNLINTFYFIEPVEHNDRGHSGEYPKMTLLKPIQLQNTDQLTVAQLEIEFLQTWLPEQTDLRDAIASENEVIEGMEALAYEFLRRMRSQKPRLAWNRFSIMTVHNNWADGVSGVSLTLEITVGNRLC